MKLIKEYTIDYIKRQKFGGARVYICKCGHSFTVPVNKIEVKCIYCGEEK